MVKIPKFILDPFVVSKDKTKRVSREIPDERDTFNFGWDVLKGTAHDRNNPDYNRLHDSEKGLRSRYNERDKVEPHFVEKTYDYFDLDTNTWKEEKVRRPNPDYGRSNQKNDHSFYIILFILVVILIILF